MDGEGPPSDRYEYIDRLKTAAAEATLPDDWSFDGSSLCYGEGTAEYCIHLDGPDDEECVVPSDGNPKIWITDLAGLSFPILGSDCADPHCGLYLSISPPLETHECAYEATSPYPSSLGVVARFDLTRWQITSISVDA